MKHAYVLSNIGPFIAPLNYLTTDLRGFGFALAILELYVYVSVSTCKLFHLEGFFFINKTILFNKLSKQDVFCNTSCKSKGVDRSLDGR